MQGNYLLKSESCLLKEELCLQYCRYPDRSESFWKNANKEKGVEKMLIIFSGSLERQKIIEKSNNRKLFSLESNLSFTYVNFLVKIHAHPIFYFFCIVQICYSVVKYFCKMITNLFI